MRRILVTGFGPFPTMPRNPSADLARLVAASPRWRLHGVEARCLVLTTAYGALRTELDPALAMTPDAVLMIGVAGRSRVVRIETRATPRRSTLFADVEGETAVMPGSRSEPVHLTFGHPGSLPATNAPPPSLRAQRSNLGPAREHLGCFVADAPRNDEGLGVACDGGQDLGVRWARQGIAGRRTPVTAASALLTVRHRGISSRISRDAGRYLCNAAYFRALGGPVPALFVHIPKRLAGRRKPQAAFRADLAVALVEIGLAMLARRRVAGAGALR